MSRSRQHLLVQYASNLYPPFEWQIEHSVFAVLMPVQPRQNRFATSANRAVFRQELEAPSQVLHLTPRLLAPPLLYGGADHGPQNRISEFS